MRGPEANRGRPLSMHRSERSAEKPDRGLCHFRLSGSARYMDEHGDWPMRCLRWMLVCLLASAPAGAQTLSGQWCGWAVQTGPGDNRTEWSAILILKGPTGSMEYPSLAC